ncbi:MAG: hypothetical protein FRX48_00964 [Lasallia pustulata]|uniref:Meiotically up-regulated protein Msb1/Mug8 domain-containing protein n=1 Tax=Lasallia pustulata TaxID=136370 RepID=A0A5M8Q1Z6_9LECA|nr:MAG: hypothetical protein FRX48_00964 [Lasallia pustulata]
MPSFSSIFKRKEGAGTPFKAKTKRTAEQNGAPPVPPQKPQWEDAWLRKDVDPGEVQELLQGCTYEIKSRALDIPFLLLPFRPASDPSAARTFIRNYFNPSFDPVTGKVRRLEGEHLSQELRLTEPMVLCSVLKWCWSRLAGGVVTWDAYELFKVGEQDSNMARDAFATFIPISVESEARTRIIFDFFDLLAAIAAHGKTNGLGGRKLSRLAGWWAFEHDDGSNGFDGGYRSWASAANATSHLFFAYLRSLSPDSVRGINGISALPLSLQALVEATEYPPARQEKMQTRTTKVAMIVDCVSPTPFALLRRAKHFEYRDDDRALREFSDFEDPVQALTDECRRVLKSISTTNQSTVSTSKTSTSLGDASWSRFEDIGFGDLGDESEHDDEIDGSAINRKRPAPQGLRSTSRSQTQEGGRPTTPSWADFLSSGFVDDSGRHGPTPLFLPPDKILPPINIRSETALPRRRGADDESNLEPGELASITTFKLDDAFWWVWITSLAGEEPTQRKAVFGRCALIETNIIGGRWLVVEEIVRGAAPEPETGAYIAEKKSRFGFSKRSRTTRSKSSARGKPPAPPSPEPYLRSNQVSPLSKSSIGPDQHARIQAAAAALQQKQKQQDLDYVGLRRARTEDTASTRTNSVFTLQPVIMSEAGPAMKWANTYDKNAVRSAYLGNNFTGRGSDTDMLSGNGGPYDSVRDKIVSAAPGPPKQERALPKNEPYGFPKQDAALPRSESGLSNSRSTKNRNLPALPQEKLQQLASEAPPQDQMPTPSSPPLPVAPAQDMHEGNQAGTQAAEAPLPFTTPTEYPTQMETKPFLAPQQDHNQLADDTVRKMNSGPNAVEETPNDHGFAGSSPENKKTAGKLKKKQDVGGGFKGFFGRKKSFQQPTDVGQATKSNEEAIAAARAALHGLQKPQYIHQSSRASLVAPQQSTVRRRLSGMAKKRAPAVNQATTDPPVSVEEHKPPFATEDETPANFPQFEPPHDRFRPPNTHFEPPQPQHQDSEASNSRAEIIEQRPTVSEFHRFNQGPLEQPAFVPQDSPEHGSAELGRPATPPIDQHEVSHTEQMVQQCEIPSKGQGVQQTEAAYEEQAVRERQRLYHQQTDDASEGSADLGSSVTPVQDRWAQIRKNAAERAKKQSEEASGQLQVDRTDDDETSGEETIESRVARIKARVAELTGNMEGPQASARHQHGEPHCLVRSTP